MQRSKSLNFFSLLWKLPERLLKSELWCPSSACWNVAQYGVSNLQREINSIIHTWYVTGANASAFLGSCVCGQGAVLHSHLPPKAHISTGWWSRQFFPIFPGIFPVCIHMMLPLHYLGGAFCSKGYQYMYKQWLLTCDLDVRRRLFGSTSICIINANIITSCEEPEFSSFVLWYIKVWEDRLSSFVCICCV